MLEVAGLEAAYGESQILFGVDLTVGAGEMVALLRELKQHCGMLLIEHDMDAVFALADRITVLVYGRAIASGAPGDIRNNVEVRQAYLGEGAG